MSELEQWLKVAICGLARDAAVEVRREILEHFEAARESFLTNGCEEEKAAGLALAALGDARVANREYRRVLLTAEEAKVLREGAVDAKIFCSNGWLRPGILALAVAGLVAAVGFAATGHMQNAGTLLLVELGMSPLVAALFLRIKTRLWGRVYRGWKWAALMAAIVLLLGPNATKFLWLLIVCLWPMVLSEIRRASIRRKLPVKLWPRHLYL